MPNESMTYHYQIELDHFIFGQGYRNTEVYESGVTTALFTAESWYKNLEDCDLKISDADLVIVRASFWREEDDPGTDDPCQVTSFAAS